MKIGYPCVNRSIGCGSKTFRLRSYTEDRFVETMERNLECLLDTLCYNVEHGILFFRISSDVVPFASHSVCDFDWQRYFEQTFQSIGKYIKMRGLRISMHPDHFTLLNSPDLNIFKRSVAELEYHAEVLDLLGLDETAKIQIHVGGVYNDKNQSMKRFVERYELLPEFIQRRLVIENDDKLYSLKDCMGISFYTGIPVLFDVFHHSLNNNDEEIEEVFEVFVKTWKGKDGLPMVDYSEQKRGKRPGSHAESIDPGRFKKFISKTKPHDFDVMLELKDKEASANRAVKALKKDPRLIKAK